RLDLDADDVLELVGFQSRVQQCVVRLGLTTHIIDHCKLVLKFLEGTNSTWVTFLQYNAQFKIFEPLEYKYDVCETILLWEQYRNMTTVLTREYLDVRTDGWLDYVAKRIAYGADKCYNRTLCDELLSILLPAKPPFHPLQFPTCAVVGNSGDLLKTECHLDFGKSTVSKADLSKMVKLNRVLDALGFEYPDYKNLNKGAGGQKRKRITEALDE
ncbi:hypothetical protein ACJX0J_041974, partial [Zea mays]